MTKFYKELVGQILKKWPQAELYFHSGSTLCENEITVTCADSWFITLSSVSGKTSAMICMVTESVQTSRMGYKFLQEYRIGKPGKEGKYPVRCMHQQKDSWLKSIYWSLSELITEIEKQIEHFTVSGDKQPA